MYFLPKKHFNERFFCSPPADLTNSKFRFDVFNKPLLKRQPPPKYNVTRDNTQTC